MRKRILHIIRKEVRQAFREPRMRAMLFMPPLIQLLVFGYAVNLDVEKAVADLLAAIDNQAQKAR